MSLAIRSRWSAVVSPVGVGVGVGSLFRVERGVGAEGVEPSCPKAAGFKPAVSAVPPRALRPA